MSAAVRTLKLPDLIALNQELAALVRAGIPLESGLTALGHGASRRLRPLVQRVAARLGHGETLVAALRAEEPGLSPVYVAIVEAGLTSGRLPEALETVVRYTEQYDDTRRTLLLSLLYPACVVALTYVLFAVLLLIGVPRMEEAWQILQVPTSPIQSLIRTVYQTAWWWMPAIPGFLLALLLLSAVQRWTTTCAGPIGLGYAGRILGGLLWLPGVGTILVQLTRAEFLELLAMLIEHDAPLPRALRLAAMASSDHNIRRAGLRLADHVEQGGSLAEGSGQIASLPALLRWTLTTGLMLPEPAETCRRVAATCRHRSERRALLLTALAAPLFVAVFAGGAVLCYCLGVGLPMIDLLNQLSIEPKV